VIYAVERCVAYARQSSPTRRTCEHLCARTGAVTGNDSTSPVPFMEASAINQRNLLPRLAVSSSSSSSSPPHLLQSTPSATLPRRPSQRTSLLSPLLLSYARARMHERPGRGQRCSSGRREERDSPRARIQRLLREAIARKTRVFHTFLLVFGSRISPEQRAKSNERARGRQTGQPSPACVVARRYPPVFCIILILCATSRARKLGIRDCATTWRASSTMVRVFENKARVSPRPLCSMEIRRGRAGEGNGSSRIGISRRGAAISAMNF